MFNQHLSAYVSLAARIRRVLDERANHQAPAQRFMQIFRLENPQ
jgi:NitT/TauT family transport system ATP-binding protein